MTKIGKAIAVYFVCATVFLGCIFIIFFSALSCSGEYKGYQGEHPGLFSVAINSIPDTTGSLYYVITGQPVLQVLEEDEYGRILFCYSEENRVSIDETRSDSANGGVNLVICQKSDDQFAYYYRDVNYITSPLAGNNKIILVDGQQPGLKDPYNGIEESKIEEFKQLNDWNKEMNLDKCNKVRIVRKFSL